MPVFSDQRLNAAEEIAKEMAKSLGTDWTEGEDCWIVKLPGVIVTIKRKDDGPITVVYSLDPDRYGQAHDKQNLKYAKGQFDKALMAVARRAFRLTEKFPD